MKGKSKKKKKEKKRPNNNRFKGHILEWITYKSMHPAMMY